MSELLVAAASEALGALMYRVGAAAYGVVGKTRKLQLAPDALLVRDSAGNEVLFSQAQVAAISDFLKSPEVVALVQTYVFARSVRRRHRSAAAWMSEARDAFVGLFESAIPDIPVATGTDAIIWDIVVKQLQAVAPSAASLDAAPLGDVERMLEGGDALRRASEVPTPRYVRQILATSSDPE